MKLTDADLDRLEAMCAAATELALDMTFAKGEAKQDAYSKWSGYILDNADTLTGEIPALVAEVKRLRRLLRQARPHIGNEYERDWPDDEEIDVMLRQIDAALEGGE